MKRREFLEVAAGGAALASLDGAVNVVARATEKNEEEKKLFRVWAMGCSHVGTDLRAGKRESLAEAIRHSEQGGKQGGPPFEWDVAVHLGDLSGEQGPPADKEGGEVVRQFAAASKHRREDFFNVAGNHDASGPNQPSMGWFRKWVDPTGENTTFSGVDPEKRRYKVEGTWERYAFRAGNLLFLMMSDRNDGGPPVGRGERGGYPAGAVTGETFEWWKNRIESNQDSVIISAHHHMLKETTLYSDEYGGFQKDAKGRYKSFYHGYFPDGAPKGASYLYFVDGKPDAQAFEGYLAEHPNAIEFWLGGHTHTNPDDRQGDRTHIERKWGVNFINCAALTRYHGRRQNCLPMSRLLTFTHGSKKVRVQCYLHTSDHAKQGWYANVERVVELGRPFQLTR